MILLIALTLLSILSGDPYISFIFSGILMILFTVRSISDETQTPVNILIFICCICFAVYSHNYFGFLIMSEVKIQKHSSINIFLPSVTYMIYSMLFLHIDFPVILLRMLLIELMSVLIFVLHKSAYNYSRAKLQTEQSLRSTVISELYEKKLNHELELENYLTDKNARLQERENISRSIHNCVGHSITASIMTLDAADMLFDVSPQKAREKMNKANERMRESLDSVRQAVRLLNTDDIYISMYDFTESIKNISGSFDMDTETSTSIDFSLADMSTEIPRDHAEFLTGAVEEMLSNGIRHGNADKFNIILSSDSRHIMIVITDNGSGSFSDENSNERIQNGFGLKKLISYTKRCGGRISFKNDNGFRTEIMLPFQKSDENE